MAIYSCFQIAWQLIILKKNNNDNNNNKINYNIGNEPHYIYYMKSRQKECGGDIASHARASILCRAPGAFVSDDSLIQQQQPATHTATITISPFFVGWTHTHTHERRRYVSQHMRILLYMYIQPRYRRAQINPDGPSGANILINFHTLIRTHV